ncbi:MAG: DUF3060 domain-containing protein [Propionicimonas sp.]|nr:DUF3060 domain-containing protein [Propionicimonas sp.]
MRGRIAAAAALLGPVLAGCSMLPVDLPSAGDLPNLGPTTVAPGATTCSHGVQYNLTAAGDYTLSGNCDLVSVTGDGIKVTSPDGFGALTIDGGDNSVEARDTGAVTVKGDDNAVTVGTLGLLTIEGKGNATTATKIGMATLSGDSNTVDGGDNLGAVTVTGNSNTVTAGTIGSITDNGTGNTITQG